MISYLANVHKALLVVPEVTVRIESQSAGGAVEVSGVTLHVMFGAIT